MAKDSAHTHELEEDREFCQEVLELANNIMLVDNNCDDDINSDAGFERFTDGMKRAAAYIRGRRMIEEGLVSAALRVELEQAVAEFKQRYAEVSPEIKERVAQRRRRDLQLAADNSELGQRRRARAALLRQLG